MESKGITVINSFDKTTTALSSSFQNVMEIIPPLHETGYINFQRNEKKKKRKSNDTVLCSHVVQTPSNYGVRRATRS